MGAVPAGGEGAGVTTSFFFRRVGRVAAGWPPSEGGVVDRERAGRFAGAFRPAFPFGAASAAGGSFTRVGHAGLMQSVQGGRPASIAVTTGARQTGHGGWSFSSFPRWGSG